LHLPRATMLANINRRDLQEGEFCVAAVLENREKKESDTHDESGEEYCAATAGLDAK
jgi:hypothetical protein